MGGFWGAVLDAICDDYQNNKSNFYVCDVAANDEDYCSGWFSSSNHKSYTTRSKCQDYSKKGDQTCCTKMKAAKKDACVTQEVVDNCDKGKVPQISMQPMQARPGMIVQPNVA